MMQTIEVRLAQGKETKGTFRYETDDPNAAVSTLYIGINRTVVT